MTATMTAPEFNARRYNAIVQPSQKKLPNGAKNPTGAADIYEVMRGIREAAKPEFGMMDQGMSENIYTLAFMLETGRTSTEFFGQLCRAKGADVKRLMLAAHKHAPTLRSQSDHKEAINKAKEELGWE